MSKVTEWSMARVLLQMVPECAPIMAREAADAFDISRSVADLPLPPSPGELAGKSLDEQMSLPYFQAQVALIGGNMVSHLGAYGVAGTMFLPMFEEALVTDSMDVDLVKRCCAFLEVALDGEQLVAEAVVLTVAENFGADLTGRVLPYAGPRFLDALRNCNWLT